MEPLRDLTRADFLTYHGQDIVSSCVTKECFSYSSYFIQKMNEASSSGDTKAEQIFSLLAGLTMLHITNDTPQSPFGVFSLDDSRVEFLLEVVDDISDPELRARIADVLCLHKPDYRMAENAIQAYLKSAERLEDPENWVETAERLERALQLSAKWGKNTENFKAVVNHIEKVLTTCDGDDPLYLSARLMTLLQDVNAGAAVINAKRAEKAALNAEAAHDWHRAREYWSVKARWHAQIKEDVERLNSKKLEAETYIKEAEDAVNRIPPSYMHAAAFMNKGMEALRRIPSNSQRVNELHHTLLAYQQKAVDEMVPISSSVDITELVNAVREHVKGQTLSDALYRLAMFLNPPKVTELRKQAEEHNKTFLLKRLMPNVYQNAMGRVIARQPKDEEESLMADMFQNAAYTHALIVQGLIEPARYQILSEHNIRVNDMLSIVINNPFIRPGREYIVARGLYLGLHGDFLATVHLLIPQAEDSIRFLLSHLKVITSSLDDDGIQDEYNLNRMLSFPQYATPLATVLGEDLVFDMRGLLVERFGANLRNDMAHGLLSHDAFYSGPSSYFWWLMLRLYALPTIAKLQPQNTEGEQ